MKVSLLVSTNSTKILEKLPQIEIPESGFLQHLSFTFAIEGISRACSHQLVRHRIASFSQQSQRYIQVKKLEQNIVVPPKMSENAKNHFLSNIEKIRETYDVLINEGVPREDARFILPNATQTSLLLTMDGKSLKHFFGLRLCTRAQWEIRLLAEEMLKLVKKIEPELFCDVGPYCVQLGKCPEGRFSCGKISEMKLKYL
ncbi:FAD-dependent thymidylate synthase [Candidatus Bathyarchaeota archaeon]|nr:FAD-dependent thymidylate synthase [Candidatus Bathyarchaeota archaeon]